MGVINVNCTSGKLSLKTVKVIKAITKPHQKAAQYLHLKMYSIQAVVYLEVSVICT